MVSLLKKIKDFHIRPKKRLGQHFLIDPQILERIALSADLESDDIVIEVGAGAGGLTESLSKKARKIYAIELDPHLINILEKQFSSNPIVEVVSGDALRFDFSSIHSSGQKRMKVVANLPYEISSPLIFRLLQEREHFSLFVLMLQSEVANRLVARPGTKDYGILSLWCQLYTRPEIIFQVRPQAFFPMPKVESTVIKFEILSQPSVEVADEITWRKIIRSAFTYRRKTLANAIHLGDFAHLPLTKICAIIQSVGINPRSRGETLSLKEFRDLSQAFSGYPEQ